MRTSRHVGSSRTQKLNRGRWTRHRREFKVTLSKEPKELKSASEEIRGSRGRYMDFHVMGVSKQVYR